MILRPKPLLLVSLIAGFLVVLGLAWTPIYNFTSNIIEMRSGSIDSHLGQITSAHSASSLDVIFGGPAYLAYESWWTSSLIDFGVVWYAINLGLTLVLLLSTLRAARRAKSLPHRAVMSALSMYSIYFVAGSLNLPFYSVFPTSFLFFFFSYLNFFGKVCEANAPVQELARNYPGMEVRAS